MTNKDRLQTWVEARKWENDDGTWQIYDPFTSVVEKQVFPTEEDIDKVLWECAMKLDATNLYGIDV